MAPSSVSALMPRSPASSTNRDACSVAMPVDWPNLNTCTPRSAKAVTDLAEKAAIAPPAASRPPVSAAGEMDEANPLIFALRPSADLPAATFALSAALPILPSSRTAPEPSASMSAVNLEVKLAISTSSSGGHGHGCICRAPRRRRATCEGHGSSRRGSPTAATPNESRRRRSGRRRL